MKGKKVNANIFLADSLDEAKKLISTSYEDKILTRYFELGYDEEDMTLDQVSGFIRTFGVPDKLLKIYSSENDIDFQLLTVDGLEEEGVVDFDKLMVLVYKMIVIAKNSEYIEESWKMFHRYMGGTEAAANSEKEIAFPDIKAVLERLKLQDKIGDGLIIDMLSTGSEFGNAGLNIYDFLVLLGRLDDLRAP